MKNVTLEDLRQPPYRATLDFDKVYLAPATRAELKREAFVAHMVFVVTQQVEPCTSAATFSARVMPKVSRQACRCRRCPRRFDGF